MAAILSRLQFLNRVGVRNVRENAFNFDSYPQLDDTGAIMWCIGGRGSY